MTYNTRPFFELEIKTVYRKHYLDGTIRSFCSENEVKSYIKYFFHY